MNKDNLVDIIAAEHNVTKALAAAIINTTFERIFYSVVQGEKVSLAGFGTFDAVHRNARVGNNPVTREQIPIPATRKPVFTPGLPFKNAVRATIEKSMEDM